MRILNFSLIIKPVSISHFVFSSQQVRSKFPETRVLPNTNCNYALLLNFRSAEAEYHYVISSRYFASLSLRKTRTDRGSEELLPL